MDARIDAVRVAMAEQGPVPVVVLAIENEDGETSEESPEDAVLPIFIGFEEAISIARGLEAIDEVGRPLTHDLLLDVMEELGGRVEHVKIRAVEDHTYLADLSLVTPRGEAVVDARPSDSLALAARTNAPIEVASEVFEEGKQPPEEFEEMQHIREVTGMGMGGGL